MKTWKCSRLFVRQIEVVVPDLNQSQSGNNMTAIIVMENVNLHVAHVEKSEAKFRHQEHVRTIAAMQYMCYFF